MARYARISTVSCGGAAPAERGGTLEEAIDANRQAQLRLAERAACDRPDAICLTEVCTYLGLSGASPETVAEPLDGDTVRAFAGLARRHATYVVVPIFTRENGSIYNSAVLLDRRGEVTAVYHKIHPTIGEMEMGVVPGDAAVVAETDFGKVGFAICYDLNFRDVAQGNAAGGAELVFFPSMYRGGLQLSIWAFDFGYFIASATPGAGSMIVNPLGRVLTESDVPYQPVISRRLNLDYKVIHLDYNGNHLAELKERYGDGVEIEVARPEAVGCLYSEMQGVSVRQILDEFRLETRSDYFSRATLVREQALMRPVPVGALL